MKVHPALQLFPMAAEAELLELTESIRDRGLLIPILICGDMILDGRARLEACRRAGVEACFHQLDEPSPTVWVVTSKTRPKDSVSRRAAIGAEALPILREERRRSGRIRGKGDSVEAIANAVDVNRGTIQRAVNLRTDSPRLFERVKSGAMTLEDARRELAGEAPKGMDPARIATREVDANRRRMEEGLSAVRGICNGLSLLKVGAIKALSADDRAMWANLANECANRLRKFAKELSRP